ncbi:hypothetical protein [Thiolapillus sp.]
MTTDALRQVMDSSSEARGKWQANAAALGISATVEDAGFLHWYRAKTPLGKIFVALYPSKRLSSAVRTLARNEHLLDAAVSLGREEELLEMIEEWINCPLDLEPVTTPSKIPAHVVIAPQDSNVDGGERGVLLVLSPALLHCLSPPSAALEASCTLFWGTLECMLILDHFSVPKQQLLALEAGSVVLMPASFEARWRCTAKPCMESAPEWPLFLDMGETCLKFFSATEEARVVDKTNMLEIRCLEPCAIPVNQLLGWSDMPRFMLSQSISSSVIEVKGEGRIAQGSLLPVARGYGVYIEKIEGTAQWT